MGDVRLVVAAGGTGGHIYPGIAVARALVAGVPGTEVLFVGTEQGLETRLVPPEGFKVVTLSSRPLGRKLSLSLFPWGLCALKGVLEASRILRGFRPDAVFGTGGYAEVPVVLAAFGHGIPVLLQEQNAIPGRANRILSVLARKVALGYGEAAPWFPKRARLTITGNPIRKEILGVSRLTGARRLGLDPMKTTVVVFGASQGARSLNLAVLEALPVLLQEKNIQVLHATGHRGFDEMALKLGAYRIARRADGHISIGNLMIVPYILDMPAALAAADLVVGRAGAISIAEIAARGLPSILIPYPHAASGHQDKNARVFQQAGAALVIPDAELDGRRLAGAILELKADPARLRAMARQSARLGKPDSAGRIVELLSEIALRR